MYKKAQKARLIFAAFSFLSVLLVIIVRLAYVQVINGASYQKLAAAQHNLTLTLTPRRGYIYSRNLKPLAASLKVFSVYADPRQVNEKSAAAGKLSKLLGLGEEFILERLERPKAFVWLKRRIEAEEAQRVNALGLKGVGLLPEYKRYYPNGELASHVLGFAGMDERGLEGIERVYERYLRGRPGRRSLLRDAKQRALPAFEYDYVPPQNGADVVLTVDEVIQHLVEEELRKAFDKNKAKGASVVVMNAHSGEIYALANLPAFNSNHFGKADAAQLRNRAVCDWFEPGSTFKIITAAAALEEKVVSLHDVFFCENGSYRFGVGRRILRDVKPYGNLTFVEVIEKSSNIGTVKIARKLGAKALYDYVKRFGFGELTGIELSGENPGLIRPPAQWSKISISAIPIGQEICVTALQMTRAMAVIANGGYLVRPHLVQKITDEHGRTEAEFIPPVPQRVISPETSAAMKEILKGVVQRGTGRGAAVPDYDVAGKTGTAQKVDGSRGYARDKYVASFIGFAPVENPRIVVTVVFDEPRPYYYGGVVCAPVFKNITEKILKYMDVPHSSRTASIVKAPEGRP